MTDHEDEMIESREHMDVLDDRIDELEAGIREVLEFLPGTAMPSFQQKWIEQLLKKALAK